MEVGRAQAQEHVEEHDTLRLFYLYIFDSRLRRSFFSVTFCFLASASVCGGTLGMSYRARGRRNRVEKREKVATGARKLLNRSEELVFLD